MSTKVISTLSTIWRPELEDFDSAEYLYTCHYKSSDRQKQYAYKISRHGSYGVVIVPAQDPDTGGHRYLLEPIYDEIVPINTNEFICRKDGDYALAIEATNYYAIWRIRFEDARGFMIVPGEGGQGFSCIKKPELVRASDPLAANDRSHDLGPSEVRIRTQINLFVIEKNGLYGLQHDRKHDPARITILEPRYRSISFGKHCWSRKLIPLEDVFPLYADGEEYVLTMDFRDATLEKK